MNALFAYGTLMCPDIMETVAKQHCKSGKAAIKGYRRLKGSNQHYPGLISHFDGRVEGRVYFDISSTSWQRLDLFEGEMYTRERVEIELENGDVISAYTYVVKDKYRNYLSTEDWDFDEFLQTGKDAFINGYGGYNDIEE